MRKQFYQLPIGFFGPFPPFSVEFRPLRSKDATGEHKGRHSITKEFVYSGLSLSGPVLPGFIEFFFLPVPFFLSGCHWSDWIFQWPAKFVCFFFHWVLALAGKVHMGVEDLETWWLNTKLRKKSVRKEIEEREREMPPACES